MFVSTQYHGVTDKRLNGRASRPNCYSNTSSSVACYVTAPVKNALFGPPGIISAFHRKRQTVQQQHLHLVDLPGRTGVCYK